MRWVYILRSAKDGGFYVGSNKNLAERVKRHNAGRVPATRGRRPLQVVYTEIFDTLSDAYKREKQIKEERSSLYIERLIRRKQGDIIDPVV